MVIEIMAAGAAVLVASTLFFPVQGKAALAMRGLSGVFFVAAAGLLAGVIALKISDLGWSSKTVILLGILGALSLGKGAVDLAWWAADSFGGQKKDLPLYECSLYQGSMLHKSGGVYYLKGKDAQGKSRRVRISHRTFEALTEKNLSRCWANVQIYPRTKIVANIKLIRR